MTELDRRQVKTIDEAITQVESLMDFKHEQHDKVKGRDEKSSYAKGGGDLVKERSSRHTPSSTAPTNSIASSSGARTTEKRAQTNKGDNCFICGKLHNYARCPKMKNLGTILYEQKEKDA